MRRIPPSVCLPAVHKDAARADLRGAGHAGRAAPRRRQQAGQAARSRVGRRHCLGHRGRQRGQYRPELEAPGHRQPRAQTLALRLRRVQRPIQLQGRAGECVPGALSGGLMPCALFARV